MTDIDSFLHSNTSRQDKALVILHLLGKPAPPASIRKFAIARGYREIGSWNVSEVLKRTVGAAVPGAEGWRLTKMGFERVERLGFASSSPHLTETFAKLRVEISRLSSSEVRSFLEEALGCLQAGWFRAAVVMSWVAAIFMLQIYVEKNLLKEFNVEASRRDGKWTYAKNTDDLSKLNEGEFLDILMKIGALQKNTKAELKGCLDRRNACGHPNSYKLSELTAAHHVEVLVLNVFAKYASSELT